MWMNYIISPKVNAEVAQYFGEAPAQTKACDPSTLAAAATVIGYPNDPKFCDKYHAADPAFWKRVYYWKTPLPDCGNGSSDCKNYNDWLQAWTSIKG
jgi:putative spermidine/putrescine transport system substrate-binding protein